MRRTFHKAILLPCLCCMSFYVGSQTVGETEASFSSQISPEPLRLATAFVFPGTIKQLDNRAEEITYQMYEQYEMIVATSPGTSLQTLRDRLAEITAIEQNLHQQFSTLQDMYGELSEYHYQLQDQQTTGIQTFGYVREGFQKADRMLKEVRETIDFQKIEAIRSSVALQIKKLEGKEKVSEEQLQANLPQVNSEPKGGTAPNQGVATHSNTNKKVTEHDEENSTHSE